MIRLGNYGFSYFDSLIIRGDFIKEFLKKKTLNKLFYQKATGKTIIKNFRIKELLKRLQNKLLRKKNKKISEKYFCIKEPQRKNQNNFVSQEGTEK